MNVLNECRFCVAARCDVRVPAKRIAAWKPNAQRKRQTKEYKRAHAVEPAMCEPSVAERWRRRRRLPMRRMCIIRSYAVREQLTFDAFGMPSMWVKIAARASEWAAGGMETGTHHALSASSACRCVGAFFNWNEAMNRQPAAVKMFLNFPFILSIDRDTETHLPIFQWQP